MERALLEGFESCGDNCEFGLLQRTFGIERLGLFRYAGVDDVGVLADAIGRRFEGFVPGALNAFVGATGWMVRHDGYGMVFHTGRDPQDASRGDVLRFAETQLRFVADKFIDDLADGRKIFVYRTKAEGDDEAAMRRLHSAMVGVGPARLLWVREGKPAVVRVDERLCRGFLPGLLPHELGYDLAAQWWLELCREAAALMGPAASRSS